ncbi:MAG: hypothetical protein WA871_14460 [Candidatus Acidiferrales bacterium]
MRNRAIVAVALILLIQPGILFADDLKPETRKAWDNYVHAVKARTEARIASQQKPFLWIDENPARLRRVRSGEIVAEPARKDDPRRVPHGLIYDWMAGVFIPNTTLDKVLEVVDDYDHYQEYFKPMIVKSKLEQDSPSDRKYTLVMVERKFGVTAAFDTENEAQLERIDDTHAYVYASTTSVQAIADYGKPNEHKYAQDSGPGYVWRLATISRLEQRDGGVYLETESLGMSRGIPAEFWWMVRPLTQHLPRRTAVNSLAATRNAVMHTSKSVPESETVATQRAH